MTEPNENKKQWRAIKRGLKRRGNHRRRQELKRDLAKNPEDPILEHEDFDRFKTAGLNGMDKDATRIQQKERNLEEENDLGKDLPNDKPAP